MKRAGLRAKILIALALISFCSMGFLIFFLENYLGKALKVQLVKRGVTVANTLSEQCINQILTRNYLALDLMLHDNLKNDPDLSYIFIINPSKQVTAHTFSNGFPIGLKDLSGVTSGDYQVARVSLGDVQINDVAVPVMHGKLGHVHVGISNTGIQAEIRLIILRVSLLILIFFLTSAIALWMYLDRVALRPVAALGRQVQKIGEGHFKTLAQVHAEDELGELSTAFNTMGENLEHLYAQMAERTNELARLNAKLEELAITDGLTGLYNHRHFYIRLREEVKRAKRYNHPLTLIMADIDHFKLYNDSLGHVAGDVALKTIAGLLTENARENDMVCRYGGEELIVILPETGLETAWTVAERMRTIVEQSPKLFAESQPGGRLTVSFGVAQLDEATDNAKGFVHLADMALYRAKMSGRNRVES